jgi:hypothetical protein
MHSSLTFALSIPILALLGCSGASSNDGGNTAAGSTNSGGATSTVTNATVASGGVTHIGSSQTTHVGGLSNVTTTKATGGGLSVGGATATSVTTTVVVTTCPVTAPTQGTDCDANSMECFYDDCPAVGRTQAICISGTWNVETATCGIVLCDGSFTDCELGDICSTVASGALLRECIPNPCGSGPVTSECARAGCNIITSLTEGVSVFCNNCPQGGCP